MRGLCNEASSACKGQCRFSMTFIGGVSCATYCVTYAPDYLFSMLQDFDSWRDGFILAFFFADRPL